MDLIINIIFVCLMTFNVSASIIEWKKIKQNHKLKKQRLKEKNEKLEEKKQKLNIDLKHLKEEKFNKNIYAKFTKEDADYVLKVTDKIKTNQDLAHFESALLKNIKIEFMRNFFINAPYITIKKFSVLEAPIKNDHRILGTYNGSTKEIKVYDKKESTLNHELLHAASSDFTYSAVGFSVEFEKAGMFGEGLNEGYTELINNRIFKYKSKSYIHLQYLARLIEDFFENKEDMMLYYFNANVFGLIIELLKSMSLEDAISIIVDMDKFIHLSDFDIKEYLKLKRKIEKLYDEKKAKDKVKKKIKVK